MREVGCRIAILDLGTLFGRAVGFDVVVEIGLDGDAERNVNVGAQWDPGGLVGA